MKKKKKETNRKENNQKENRKRKEKENKRKQRRNKKAEKNVKWAGASAECLRRRNRIASPRGDIRDFPGSPSQTPSLHFPQKKTLEFCKEEQRTETLRSEREIEGRELTNAG